MEKKIGIEVEFTGVTRERIVECLEYLFETEAESVWNASVDEPYRYYRVKDKDGGVWLVVRDRSIQGQAFLKTLGYESTNYRFSNMFINDESYKCELVSPVLTSKTLPTLFSVIDVIKANGGIVNISCGIHVHIDRPDNFDDLWSLFHRFYVQQEKLVSDFNVYPNRLNKYCKLYHNFPDNKDYFEGEEDFMEYLYTHYTETDSQGEPIRKSLRYYAFNLHSSNSKRKTIEFRLFNSSLDKVEVARILNWVINFAYSSTDSMKYLAYLGGILSNEMSM